MKLNKQTTASFDIDPQKGFTPICPNELPVDGGDQIAGELNKQADLASIRVFSKDAHPPTAIWAATSENPQFSAVEGEDVDIRWNMHCVPGTEGFELLDELPSVKEYDYAVYKGIESNMHPYGACYHDLDDNLSTGVIEYLKSKNIETVICGGLATDHCVRLTVLQLLNASFSVIVNLAACRGIDPDAVEAAIEEMKAGGAIIINSEQELCVA